MPSTIEMRGDVIEKSIEIEMLVSEIITRHYFGQLYNKARGFVENFLDLPSFSFTLKLNALLQVFDGWKRTSERLRVLEIPEVNYLDELIADMRILNTQRNDFAHLRAQRDREHPNLDMEYSAFLSTHGKVLGKLKEIRDKFERAFPAI
jgi:hypothetical protein